MIVNAPSSAQVLMHAADLIEQHGHRKGEFRDMHGRYCAYGALRDAAGIVADGAVSNLDYNGGKWLAFRSARHALEHHLSRESGGTWSISRWNDAPERTTDEVIAALRGATAKAVRTEGRQRR
jgi:hypothetical protein